MDSIDSVIKELDKKNIFVLFTPSNLPAFYDPGSGTGKLLLSALKKIKKNYPIDDKSLIYIGESAGGVAAASFASWKPEICSAWVAYGATFDHTIKEAAKNIPFFMGCGKNDERAYRVLKKITANNDEITSNGIFKHYKGKGHCPDLNGYQLMFSCLLYFHQLNEQHLNKKHIKLPVEFIGDASTNTFYELSDDRIQSISTGQKVNLPNFNIAKLWGKKAR